MTEPVFWRGQAGPVPATSCGVERNGFASFIRLFSTCGLLALLCGGAPLHAQTGDPQIRYSIESPRAASSLLLDVTHAGERLVAAGDRGHILYSDDGGASWTQAKVPTRQLLTAIYFADAQHGWAVGHDALFWRAPMAARPGRSNTRIARARCPCSTSGSRTPNTGWR